MNILGISALYHDASAALLVDGDLVAAAGEERFSRIKSDPGLPRHAIDFCLREAGLGHADLDYVVFYEKPLRKFQRILLSSLHEFPRSLGVFRESLLSWFHEKLWVKSDLMALTRIPESRLLFIDHHLSHAASAFFCSPFENAAVMTVDGVGEWTTTALGVGSTDSQGSTLTLTEEIRFPHSLGLLYSTFTAWLGFEVNEGEYKVMGMAAYGQPRHVEKIRRVLKVASDGSFQLDLRYFAFQRSHQHSYSRAFVELFGPARDSTAQFVPGVPRSQHYADVAASLQLVLEETILAIAAKLQRETGLENLVLAGGVALNSKVNGRLLGESPFANVYVQPNPGDGGGALGAALYAWHVLLGNPRKHRMDHAYHGESYGPDSVREALEKAGVAGQELSQETLVKRTVEALAEGKVVGLVQGRFEWGPRALGNRSILADPRHESTKALVNGKIKFREPFRPFAPVIDEAEAARYFETGGKETQHPLRFMQAVLPVRADKAHEIQAVDHLGSSRVQTLREEWNPFYHALVEGFGQATGVPVLLNTSFNLKGEPIVSSPEDACETFLASGLDLLVMPPFLARKAWS